MFVRKTLQVQTDSTEAVSVCNYMKFKKAITAKRSLNTYMSAKQTRMHSATDSV